MFHGPRPRRVIVQQASESQDSYGEPIVTWANYCHTWATIIPFKGSERFASAFRQAEVTMRLRIRYDAKTKDIVPKMRVLHGSRVFDIESVINVNERNDEIHLLCSEDV